MPGGRNRKGDLKDVFSQTHAKEAAGVEGTVAGGSWQGWETPGDSLTCSYQSDHWPGLGWLTSSL